MEKYNSVLKIDSNGTLYQRVVFSMPIIEKGLKTNSRPLKINSEPKDEEENLKRAQRRARTKVKDYVKTNTDLIYFVTYTLSPEVIEDRCDERAIYKKLRSWLMNAVARKSFKYVLVPEQHEDGAWHFHGFTNLALEWKFGYYTSFSVRDKSLNDTDRTINYITGYIGKNNKKFNGRYYLHSNNLKEPTKIYANLDFDEESGYCKEIKNGLMVKING